jgi:hypothetical protein
VAENDYDDVFEAAAQAYGVDADVLKGIAYAESRFRPDIIQGKVRSPKGAIGMMQFMPETAKEYGINPLDPIESITGAAAYLKKSLDRFNGDYGRAIASYNWGPNRKAYERDDWVTTAPSETQNYLLNVLDYADKRRSSRPAPRQAEAPAPEEPQSALRQVADVPLKIGQGAVQGVRMIAEAFGAGSELGQNLRGAEEYIGRLMSAEAKKDEREIGRIMQEAEDKGMGEQIKAAFRAFGTAPVDILAQGLGTAAPALLSILGAKILGAGALATTAISGTVGIGQGLGVVKGTIYDATKEALLGAGMSEEQAEARAQLAQSYGGENLDMILAGGALGGIAATTGIEKIAAQRLAKEIMSKSMAGRVATGAVTEAVPEFVQAGQEQVAENIALQREGFDVPTMRGVAGAATLEGLAGAGLGAGFGVMPSGGTPERPDAEREEPLPQRETPPEVATLPPGTFTEQDIEAAAEGIPASNLPIVRRSVLGKTPEELRAFVDENPEILEDDSPTARIIRALLEPAGERDQSGMGIPVPSAGEPGVPGAQPAIPPERGGVAGVAADVAAPIPTTPSPAPTVTETPSGITTPEAIEAEAQRPQEPIDTAPVVEEVTPPATPEESWNVMTPEVRQRVAEQAGVRNPENFGSKAWKALSKANRDKLAGSMLTAETEPATSMPGEPVPSDEQAEAMAGIAELEKERRKIEREDSSLLGKLRRIGLREADLREVYGRNIPLPARNLIGKEGTGKDITSLVADGTMDPWLPFDMRLGMARYDEQDAAEIIKDRLRNQDYLTEEAKLALRGIDMSIEDLTRALRQEDINAELEIAAQEQRERDQEAEADTARAADRDTERDQEAQAPPAAPDLKLTPPSPEAQAEAERRAEEAPAEQEREQVRRESEVGAGQFRLEGGEGRQDTSGDLFKETEVRVSPEKQKRDALNLFERAMAVVVPNMRARVGNRRVNINPKALTAPQRTALVELASDAVDLGMPASILSNVRAAGATSMNSTAAINSENGWLLLGKDWNGRPKAEKLFAVIHELGHTTDYGPSGMGNISKTDQWKKSHEELKAWYESAPNGHPLTYPFSRSFAGKIRDLRLESYAQAFALYFTSPVDLQSNAPTAYAKIQSIIEGIQNESRTASRTGPPAPSGATVEVQPARVGQGAEVQPAASEVGTGVGRAERGQDRDLGEVDLDEIVTPDIRTEAETAEDKAKRDNIFGEGVLSTWNTPTDTKILGADRDSIIYTLQNKQIDLKRVVDAIIKTGKDIGAKWDAYLQETLYHGRTAKRTQDYLKNELEKQVELMQKYGLTKEEVGTYLHNRHAEEANRHIAERNPQFPDGGSGINTEDARAYLAGLKPEKRKQLEEVAKLIDDSVRTMQDELVRDGLESADTINTWREMFQYYIPLNRVDSDFDTHGAMSQGAGYSTSGVTAKSRTGSAKLVDPSTILANLAMQRERAIVRGEKNKVSNALYGLALTNPNPEVWLALDPSTDPVWKSIRLEQELKNELAQLKALLESGDVDANLAARYQREIDLTAKLLSKETKKASAALEKAKEQFAEMGLSEADVRQIMMPPMQARYDKVRKKVVYEPNASVRNRYVLATRVNGQEKYVLFNANNPRAKRMAEALKNMDGQQLGQAMNTMAKVTRWMAAVNTQYNPVFGAYNFLRDVQTGLLQINDTAIADKKSEVVAGTMPAMKAIYQSTRKLRKGEKVDSDWAKLWEEFQQEGGQTGFRDVFSQSDERAAAIQKMIDPSTWAESPLGKVFTAGGTLKMPFEQARKTAAPLFEWLSDYNSTMENAVRLSAYKAAKAKFISEGMSATDAKQRAAAIAKDLTVNFNRKGAIANQAGAMYAFFNASVQGTTRMFQLLNSPIGRKIAAGAFLLGVVQAVTLAAAGFDDEEPADFVKQRNYIIPTGDGKYLAFPMPLGFNVLPNTSRVLTEWALSGFEDTSRRVLEITDAMFDMFNPIGNAGWSYQSISPTAFDPLVALSENKDWTGKQIALEDFNRTDPTPGYTRSKDNANWLTQTIAEFLNTVSGGDQERKGIISPTAEQIEYLVGQATGGVGREVMKAGKTGQAIMNDEELPSYNVPLFGRFYGNVTGMAPVSNKFYRNMTELNIHKRAIERIAEEGGDVRGYLEKNPEAMLHKAAGTQYREVQKLRKARIEMLNRGDKANAKRLEEQIKTRMDTLNKLFDEKRK